MNSSSGKINVPEDQHRGGSQPNVSRECLWILYGDEHKKIQLTIKVFDDILLNDTNESLQVRLFNKFVHVYWI